MKNIYLHKKLPIKKYCTTILSLALSIIAVLTSSQAYAAKDSADWDNDGLTDEVESLIGSEIYLSDTDGDGISDKVEVGNITEPRDSDKDGVLDVLDVDDDGDGIPSAIEGTSDTDKDGKPAYLDTDSDADGLADKFEIRLTGKDSDKDGVDDLFDVDSTKGQDSNGDGIDENVTLIDSNKNGTPDLLDSKSTIPHIAPARRSAPAKKSVPAKKSASIKKSVQTKKVQSAKPNQPAKETKIIEKPVIVAATSLPTQVVKSMTPPKPKKKHRYMNNTPTANKEKALYGGAGYFYCTNTGKIVNNIPGFKMTPQEKVTLLRDASKGDYKWSAKDPGTYALQFQIPQGMSIVRGLAKGRRIVKAGDANPLILGADKNPSKKGYLIKKEKEYDSWYTSFEIKDNAPFIANNNIPLSGGICDK